jgi:hypothetical protein
MTGLFATDTAKKQPALKRILLAFIIFAAAALWIGISAIQADETDSNEYAETNEVNFQNAAQERHAKNLAIKLTLRDEAVMHEVLEAKKNEEYERARDLFKTAVDENIQEISNRRAEGWGWGYIAKYYDVHPKYLGLGHYKNKAKLVGLNHSSPNKARGLALGHNKDKGGSFGVAQGRGNGNGGGRGGGKNK